MKAKYLIMIFVILFHWNISYAQEVEEAIERMAEYTESTPDFEELQEQWIQLTQHPVDLNSAKEDDLRNIPGISEVQIKNLLEYKTAYGEILSVYELMAVSGFDSLSIMKIRPYFIIRPISTNPHFSLKNLFRFSRQSLLVRYGQTFPNSMAYQKADPDTGDHLDPVYPGSPQHYYFRYTFSWYDKIQIGLAGDKDPGEQFFRGEQSSGMDYYSGYISLSNLGILKNLTVGTFRAGFGQGLTFGSGSSMGSVPGFLSGLSYNPAARGSISVSESNYLKGLTTTFRIRKLEITGFISYHNLDANITKTDSVSGKALEFSSLGSSGYHRTSTEIADRNSITELLTGGNINFTGRFYKIGMSGYYSRWSASLKPKTAVYNQFALRGNESYAYGLDYQVRLNPVFLFGEISRCQSGKIAFIAGLNAEPDSRVKMRIIYRNYPAGFANRWANAFGQQSSNNNESGIYAAVQAELHTRLMLSAYADIYRYPWLRYNTSRPSPALEFGIQLNSPITRSLTLSARYFYTESSSNEDNSVKNTEKIIRSSRQNLRIRIDWIPQTEIILNSRIELNRTEGGNEPERMGYLICQDIHYKPVKFPLGLIFRYALFDIPTYNERIYTYEPEVLFGFSVPAFYGQGMRVCALLNGKVNRQLKCWVKAGMTRYFNRNILGSGQDSVNSNTKFDLIVQLMLQL